MDKITAGMAPANKLAPGVAAVEVHEHSVGGISSTLDQLSFSNDKTRHEYQPLSNPISFRILELIPGVHNRAIRITLHHRSLYAVPIYDALSYKWGESVRQHKLMCDGRTLRHF
jgi:hypothetical protein